MQETWVESLGWEDPLEEEIASQSSMLAWKIPKTEEPGRLQATGLQRVGHTERLTLIKILIMGRRYLHCSTITAMSIDQIDQKGQTKTPVRKLKAYTEIQTRQE